MSVFFAYPRHSEIYQISIRGCAKTLSSVNMSLTASSPQCSKVRKCFFKNKLITGYCQSATKYGRILPEFRVSVEVKHLVVVHLVHQRTDDFLRTGIYGGLLSIYGDGCLLWGSGCCRRCRFRSPVVRVIPVLVIMYYLVLVVYGFDVKDILCRIVVREFFEIPVLRPGGIFPAVVCD